MRLTVSTPKINCYTILTLFFLLDSNATNSVTSISSNLTVHK